MTVFSTYAIVLLSLLIIIFLLCFTKLTKNKYLFVLLITIALSVLAFFHDPITARSNGDYTDLYRFYKTLDLIKGHPFNNNISIFQEYNNLIIMKIFFLLHSTEKLLAIQDK